MLNIKSFPVILLLWVCLISENFCVCVRACMCGLLPSRSSLVPLQQMFLLFLLPQLKHMMVMTGYPDILLVPELIDREYGVSHRPSRFPFSAPSWGGKKQRKKKIPVSWPARRHWVLLRCHSSLQTCIYPPRR